MCCEKDYLTGMPTDTPLLIPIEKTDFKSMQAVIEYAYARILGIKNITAAEHYPGIATGELIKAATIEVESVKANSILYCADAKNVRTAKQRTEKTDSLFFYAKPIVIKCVPTESEKIISVCQENTPKIVQIHLTGSTKTVLPMISADMCTLIGFDTGLNAVLPSPMALCSHVVDAGTGMSLSDFCAAIGSMEYRLDDLLPQYAMITIGAGYDVLPALHEKTSLQTDRLTQTAFPVLSLEQYRASGWYADGVFAAYGMYDIRHGAALRSGECSVVGGSGILLHKQAGINEERGTVQAGSCIAAEPELPDGISARSGEDTTPLHTDTRPTIRLPIEASCGAVVMGVSRMNHSPNVLEVVDLDSTHFPGLDAIPVDGIDLWPVRADDNESHFRYQF